MVGWRGEGEIKDDLTTFVFVLYRKMIMNSHWMTCHSRSRLKRQMTCYPLGEK
jgi:hypothetical protein